MDFSIFFSLLSHPLLRIYPFDSEVSFARYIISNESKLLGKKLKLKSRRNWETLQILLKINSKCFPLINESETWTFPQILYNTINHIRFFLTHIVVLLGEWYRESFKGKKRFILKLNQPTASCRVSTFTSIFLLPFAFQLPIHLPIQWRVYKFQVENRIEGKYGIFQFFF